MIKTYSTLGHLAANSFHLERHIGPSPEENFLVSIGRSLPEEDLDIKYIFLYLRWRFIGGTQTNMHCIVQF